LDVLWSHLMDDYKRSNVFDILAPRVNARLQVVFIRNLTFVSHQSEQIYMEHSYVSPTRQDVIFSLLLHFTILLSQRKKLV